MLLSDIESSRGSLDEDMIDEKGNSVIKVNIFEDKAFSEDSLIEKLDSEKAGH